jgi:type VI secretion system protein ImpC
LPPDIRPTGLYRLLVDQTIGVAGAEPWTLLLGCYTFDKTEADLALLRRLTRIAQAAGAPFLAAAHSHFAGCESVAATPDPHDWHWQPAPAAAAAWHDLRRSEFAPWLGLALPRLLMRLPYGPNTESIERFDFEENPQPIEHERYLWGNPAALCVVLLAAAFRQVGWTLTGALRQEVAGLPTHTFTVNREKRVTPPAEAVLTERAMQDIVERGLIPMLSIKGRDAVRFARYQSVAAPARALAGRWR